MPKKLAVQESDDDDKKKPTKKTKKTEGQFFDDLLKKAGLELPVASKASEPPIKFFDTGSYMLNGLLCGSLRGGIASKVTAFAGEEATGKTFIALQIIRNFLDTHPKSQVFIFDSEDDPMKSVAALAERDIDINRIRVIKVNTIQEFRTTVVKLLNGYLATPEDQRLPMFICLDSLGNLSTMKEMKDIGEGKLNKKGEEIKDMTRPSLIRGAFRVISIKLGKAEVPMLMTNHTYENTGDPYGAKKNMCLVKGTKILGENCPVKIEDVVPGDKVRTIGSKETVSNVYVFDSDDIYEIEFADGSTVQCTGEHKFLTQDLEWTRTTDLNDEDVVMAVD